MNRGIGYASVTSAASAAVLCLIGVAAAVVCPSDPLPAAGEHETQVVQVTLWDNIRAMGWSGMLLILLLGLALVTVVINLVNLRRLSKYVAPAGAAPAHIALATSRFLIAPGALVGTGTLAVVVGGLGMGSGFFQTFHIVARYDVGPDHLPAGISMSLAPACTGFLIGALAIGAGLVFRGIVALRLAQLVRECAKARTDLGQGPMGCGGSIMRRGDGHASVAAVPSARVLRPVCVVIIAIIMMVPFAGGIPITLLDCLVGMGWSAPVLSAFLGGVLVMLILNAKNVERIEAYAAPAGTTPEDIEAATERFLIAPGALIGMGTSAILIGIFATTARFIRMFNILTRTWDSPDYADFLRGLIFGFLSASFGFLIGALGIGAGLVFRGIVARHRARLVGPCAKG